MARLAAIKFILLLCIVLAVALPKKPNAKAKVLRGSPRNPNRVAVHHPKPIRHDRPISKVQKPANFSLAPNSKNKRFDDAGPYSYDYLLGEDSVFDTPADVVFVDYDIDESVIQEWLDEGKMVICYVNVGAWEEWRSDADDFPESVLGNDYDGWPGEQWLDINARAILLPIMRRRFEAAAAKGCEGIDPDNMNGYSVDTGFTLSYANQITYNRAISQHIRDLGMLAGMKNDNEQASDLLDYMDFGVLEQCAAYDECHYFDVFIETGKPIFAVEYTDEYDEDSFWDEVCPLGDDNGMSYILKDYDLHGDFIVSCLFKSGLPTKDSKQ